ncbi:Coq4 family protein [Synechococcus sp. ROS8604]|uniref:Coq4 family protein n=1 Tax=Synechococcus sp. ROS8604 TaxID=1442557 RepID=UPI0016466085|nr:Coq4 family protein [Synechococcus sp. ROS8604]QNI88486.1 plastoquinone biosynthesis coenzyme/ Coq4 family protein [Synechococcus sp. ROS8604]
MPSAHRNLLKRLAVDLAALCSNPNDLDHAFDLLNATYSTDVAQAARDRLKADPSIQALVKDQYWGHWPTAKELVDLPAGSLGHVYGLFLTSQGLSELPAPELSKEMASDDTYLQLRIRYTHDLWHVIAGLPITMAGEAAANGLTTEQLRWPGSALLIAADLVHRVSDADEVTAVDVGVAIAYGLNLGATAQPLLAQRWEEGWETPLQTWRDALGIRALLRQSPFPLLTGENPRS